MLFHVDDIAAMLADEIGDGRAQAFAVGALDEQNRCIFQSVSACGVFYLSPSTGCARD
jgi:hypothetical protein